MVLGQHDCSAVLRDLLDGLRASRALHLDTSIRATAFREQY